MARENYGLSLTQSLLLRMIWPQGEPFTDEILSDAPSSPHRQGNLLLHYLSADLFLQSSVITDLLLLVNLHLISVADPISFIVFKLRRASYRPSLVIKGVS
jgi:hypothetical protein